MVCGLAASGASRAMADLRWFVACCVDTGDTVEMKLLNEVGVDDYLWVAPLRADGWLPSAVFLGGCPVVDGSQNIQDVCVGFGWPPHSLRYLVLWVAPKTTGSCQSLSVSVYLCGWVVPLISECTCELAIGVAPLFANFPSLQRPT